MTSAASRMRHKSVAAFAATTTLAVTLTGCAAAGGSSSPTVMENNSSSSLSGEITVFAASSLTEAFDELKKRFESANPEVTITFSYAASSALAEQINSGAPADVFASASAGTMDQVVEAGNAEKPTTFAVNVMQIAVPPANPANITSVDELADPKVKVALCQPQVPCGSIAQEVFTNAGISVTPVTLEPDVKSVLSKVQLGEVDAGMVYVTDVQAAGDKVEGVLIPDDVNASTSYPIATLTGSENGGAAEAFVEFVLSADGQNVVTEAGFAKP
jgi:molybdate transport system substrate-binding protein